MLGCTVGVDFELDQWTFFKPATEDLRRLYGLDVHEMQPYRGLVTQLVERLRPGRPWSRSWTRSGFPTPRPPPTAPSTSRPRSSSRRSTRRPRCCATSTTPGTSSCRGRTSGGSWRPAGPRRARSCRRTSSWSASTPTRRPATRRCGRPPGTCWSPTWPGVRAATRSRLPVPPGDRPARAAGRRPGRLPRARLRQRPDGRGRLRAAGRPPAVALRRGGRADRRGVLDDVVGGTKMLLFRLARRRAFDVGGVLGPHGARAGTRRWTGWPSSPVAAREADPGLGRRRAPPTTRASGGSAPPCRCPRAEAGERRRRCCTSAASRRSTTSGSTACSWSRGVHVRRPTTSPWASSCIRGRTRSCSTAGR